MADQTQFGQEDLSKPQSLREYLRIYFSGFVMGASDIVPGVSGGTMAFILGIYNTLINAIKSVNVDVIRMGLKFDISGVLERVPYRFLIALALGLGSAVLLLASLLENLLEEQPTFLFAFFAGLIIASILAIGMKMRWSPVAMGALFVFAGVAFVITGFDDGETDPVKLYIQAVEDGEGIAQAEAALIAELEAFDYETPVEDVAALRAAVEADAGVEPLEEELESAIYNPSSVLVLFISGAIAICAMLLPGISGSFILLILGQYAVILGAVNALDIVSIGAVGLGAVVGLVSFSRVISWLLNNYENVTIAALVGFMLGSLRKIWIEMERGMDIVSDTGQLDAGQWVMVAVLIFVGFLLVSFLDHLQSRTNPVFAWFWKPAPPVDDIAQKAQALE